MIENEIAKLENPLQPRLQLLLVAELGEPLLVARQRPRCSARRAHAPPREKRSDVRPSLVTIRSIADDVKRRPEVASGQDAALCERAAPQAAPAAAPRARARCPAGARSSRARRASRRGRGPPPAGGGAGRWRRRAPRAGGRCSEIRSVIAPCTSVIARHEPARCRSSRPAPRAGARRPGGRRGSPRACRRARRPARRARRASRGVGALGGEHRDAELDRQALVADVAPLREQLRATAGRAGGCGSATNVPPPRPRVACRWPLCAERRRAPGAASSARSRAARTARARPAAASRAAAARA